MSDADQEEIFHPGTGESLNPPEVRVTKDGKPGKSLDQAMLNILGELPIWITQDTPLPVSKSVTRSYASLKAIMTIVRPACLKHGVRIRQGCEHAWAMDLAGSKGRAVPVFTELRHVASGEWERTTVEIPVARMDAPSMGSAISYGRRYGVLAVFCLTTDEAEDDGQATKSRDVAEDHEESQELWVLKSEISECATMEALSKLREKVKASGRLDKLSDADFALAQRAFKERKLAIEKEQDAPQEVSTKKGK